MPGMAGQAIRVRLERYRDTLLAQCIGCPSILVTGRTRAEVRANLKECIAGYVQAFPRTRRRFFAAGGKRMKRVEFVTAAPRRVRGA